MHGNEHPQEVMRGDALPVPVSHENMYLEPAEILITEYDVSTHQAPVEIDELDQYVEVCFTSAMAPVILDEHQLSTLKPDEVATMRIYISANAKRAVVIKEDDLLTKKELLAHSKAVADATIEEIKIRLNNYCFRKCLLKDAQNIMT